MPSKLVRTTVLGGGGTGGGPPGDDALQPDIVWAENPKFDDTISLFNPKITDRPLLVDDNIKPSSTIIDKVLKLADTKIATVTLDKLTTSNPTLNDIMLADIAAFVAARSGTPDDDAAFGDAYVAQSAPTSNTGVNGTMLVRCRDAVNTNEFKAYFYIDMRRFASCVAQSMAVPFELSLWVSHDAIVASSFNYDFRRYTTKPFVESTMTWNVGQPSGGTSVASGTRSVATGATGIQNTFQLNESITNAIIADGWLGITLTDTVNTVTRPTFSFRTREAGATAQRPSLDLFLRRI